MPKGYPKDGRPPGRPENLVQNRRSFAKGDERAKQAGAKGNATQKAMREMKEILLEQLAAPVQDRDGKTAKNADGSTRTVKDKLAKSLIQHASLGDMTAHSLILKLIGEYPEERSRVTVAEAVPQIIDDIPGAPPTKRGGARK